MVRGAQPHVWAVKDVKYATSTDRAKLILCPAIKLPIIDYLVSGPAVLKEAIDACSSGHDLRKSVAGEKHKRYVWRVTVSAGVGVVDIALSFIDRR